MAITKVFSIDGLIEEGQPAPTGGFAYLDQGRVLMPATYFDDVGNPIQLSKLAIIDINTDTVTYDLQTECGGMVWGVKTLMVIHTLVLMLLSQSTMPSDHRTA